MEGEAPDEARDEAPSSPPSSFSVSLLSSTSPEVLNKLAGTPLRQSLLARCSSATSMLESEVASSKDDDDSQDGDPKRVCCGSSVLAKRHTRKMFHSYTGKDADMLKKIRESHEAQKSHESDDFLGTDLGHEIDRAARMLSDGFGSSSAAASSSNITGKCRKRVWVSAPPRMPNEEDVLDALGFSGILKMQLERIRNQGCTFRNDDELDGIRSWAKKIYNKLAKKSDLICEECENTHCTCPYEE